MKNKKINKKTLIIDGVILAIIAVIVVMMKGKGSIDLNDYVVVSTKGYNGYATVSAEIDWESFEQDYGSKIKYTANAKKKYAEKETALEHLENNVEVKVDAGNEVHNNMNITYEIEVADETTNCFSKKIDSTTGTYKVEGLEEVKTFDLLDKLNINVTGQNGLMTLQLTYNGEEFTSEDFIVDKDSWLCVGDTVTISIDTNQMQHCARTYGIKPKQGIVKYTITEDDLGKYATDLSALNTEAKETLKLKAYDCITEFVTKNFSNITNATETLENCEYVGTYMNVQKTEGAGNNTNEIHYVYKVTVHDTYAQDGYEQLNEYYIGAYFPNMMVDDAGNLKNSQDAWIEATGYVEFKTNSRSFSYAGYSTLEEITSHIQSELYDLYEEH